MDTFDYLRQKAAGGEVGCSLDFLRAVLKQDKDKIIKDIAQLENEGYITSQKRIYDGVDIYDIRLL